MKISLFISLVFYSLIYSPAYADLKQIKPHHTLLPYYENGKWGYMNSAGEVVLSPQFDVADFFSEDLARVNVQGKWGYINPKGEIVIPPSFDCDDFSYFFGGLAAVKIKGKYGFIDTSGKLVIQPKFNETYGFSEKRAAVRIAKKWGYIGPDGSLKIPFVYDQASDFWEGLAPVRKGDSWGYIDPDGNVKIPFQFETAWCFSEKLAVARKAGLDGYIDLTGKFVIQPQFDQAWHFTNGLAPVRIHDHYFYVDQNGKFQFLAQFEKALEFAHQFAPIQSGRRWGYIDRNGRIAISPVYDFATEFLGDLGIVFLQGQWIYVNKAGKEVKRFPICEACAGKNWTPIGPACSFTDEDAKCLDLGNADVVLDSFVAQTREHIFVVGMALQCYYAQYQTYPDVNSIHALRSYLEPLYISVLPLTDGWGIPWYYHSDGQSYKLASGGLDLQIKPETWDKSHTSEDLKEDLVFSNGEFLKSWSVEGFKQFQIACSVSHDVRKIVDETEATIRQISAALEAYAIDSHAYPQAKTLGELNNQLIPNYSLKMETVDGWGTELKYIVNTQGKKYRIISAGRDKEFDDSSWLQSGLVCDTREDAVFENGRFLRWWPQ